MLKLKCFMCVIMMFCFSYNALAQTPSCEKPQIFFVNGIWNKTPLDTLKGAAELEVVLIEQGIFASQYGSGGTTKYAVRPFWNPGDGYVQDVLEVFLNQRKAGKALAEAINDANLVWIKRLAASIGANKPGAAFQQYIDEMTAQMGSEIGKRRPVLIVAHSQGNILTNRAVAAVLEKNPDLNGWISIVGVGVADDKRVGEGYRYVTNDKDFVIGPLVGALTSNFIVGSSGSKDISGHEFIDYYLSSGVLGSNLFNGTSLYTSPIRPSATG